MITLTAAVRPQPEEPDVRQLTAADLPRLAQLYWDAYEPGVACATFEEAEADIEASFAGAYGPMLPEACLGTEGELVAAILVVTDTPWDDGPFIIELFTDPAHRRSGLGRRLVGAAMSKAADSGVAALSLRVAEDNTAALSLYRSMGFTPA